ncbi:4-alpha-glucanotransferase [Nostoc sp. FACHB-280]|uniref:4-alpha-glucanotransferase n=1 Tax=Nostoc sp. FACHB-280 TaxID=2692839 RepID=UPI00168BACF0|nr:4-alpha-glucanotransferase [Nostoc sp. FACHB-280]MBD2495671.1 4-alpha-glucanotransferase [Nostoc sp. FACHB-280]
MPFPRSSGILLHPTSFPSRFGIGDLGLAAYKFIDFLRESYQQYWQVLPLGPTGYGNSPYAAYSAMAGNPFLISPEKLQEQGLLAETDFANLPEFNNSQVDYDKVIGFKTQLLKIACKNFQSQATPLQQTEFAGFCDSKAYWLDDYALFMALKDAHEGASWHTWEPELVKREPAAIEQAKQQLSAEIFYYKFIQFEFFREWSELKTYANMSGIQIIGDIPIYVAQDSADVWSHPEIFCLDEETREPKLMAGVPPDYFSATGQLWGNPVYDWEELQNQNFKWWIGRFEAMLDYLDVIRIDHFRGFEAYWAVPQGEETAINGEWVKAPGDELFAAIKEALGKLPVLAEDLGVITPEVEALRDKYEFPGMKVLQFAFGSDPGNPFLPFNYSRNFVVYTGTHDNDTSVGWFDKANDYEKHNFLLYLGCISPEGVHWDLIRLALSSVANQAIIPLQDVLGLGTDARMNFPSVAEGNWGWRYHTEALSKELSDRLKTLTQLYGRAPQPK